MSSCEYNVIYNRESFTIQPLMSDSQYEVAIQAESGHYSGIVSSIHVMDIFTLVYIRISDSDILLKLNVNF